jgi:hypothetical protein
MWDLYTPSFSIGAKWLLHYRLAAIKKIINNNKISLGVDDGSICVDEEAVS